MSPAEIDVYRFLDHEQQKRDFFDLMETSGGKCARRTMEKFKAWKRTAMIDASREVRELRS